MSASDDLLTSVEAAALLRISDRQVRNLASAGVLPRIRYGSRWWFRRASLVAWIAAQEQPGAEPAARSRAARQPSAPAVVPPSNDEIHARLAAMRAETRQQAIRQTRRMASGANVAYLPVPGQDGAASSVSTRNEKA